MTDETHGLKNCKLSILRRIASDLNLNPRKSKSNLIPLISSDFDNYLRYKKEKIDKYKKIEKLGKGKEGITYLVKDEKGNRFAMKTFKKTKSSKTLKREYKLQEKAASCGVAPKVYEYDIVSKYIIMDLMDGRLIDIIKSQGNKLYRYQQARILEIYRKLDQCRVFHGDANLANYMHKDKIIYLIDYGFAKKIDRKLKRSVNSDLPNFELMLLGFILKMKDSGFGSSCYNFLLKEVPEKTREKFQI